ncbi:MAG: MBL fold metallo-hydrolase, partial [Oscillospiraceae bacterium]
MKIKYLGTAAAEGWPAVFCRCDACVKAAKLKGKNIRTRSQMLINEDLLIDFPAESYYRAVVNDIDLSAIKFLLVTHSHSDHFYPQELVLRGGCYAHDMTSPKLKIFCNKYVKEDFDRCTKKELEAVVADTLEWHIIEPFDQFEIGTYKITALPAKHTRVENDLLFLIESEGKFLLYCNDTGRLYENVYAYLKDNSILLDMVSFDCTGGPIENGEESGHMGFADNIVVREKLKALGVVHKDTQYTITHFSHNGGLMHS